MLISLCKKEDHARNAVNFLAIQMSGLSMRYLVILKKMEENAGIAGKYFLEVISSLSMSLVAGKNKRKN